ncbi:putative leader peptide [Nakamurella alba]
MSGNRGVRRRPALTSRRHIDLLRVCSSACR